MFDVNFNSFKTYKSDEIEKLKKKTLYYEYQTKYSKVDMMTNSSAYNIKDEYYEAHDLGSRISESRCFGKKTCPL